MINKNYKIIILGRFIGIIELGLDRIISSCYYCIIIIMMMIDDMICVVCTYSNII
jgi:hypothetical protein